MQILKATPQDIPAIKELWKYMFDDGTAGFCDFVFEQCKADDVYINLCLKYPDMPAL